MIKKYKKDIILISAILLFAIIIFLVINLLKKPGNYVVVVHDQKEVLKYSLDDDIEVRLSFIEDTYNVLIIEDGKAYIKDASCPDGLCVKYSKISRTGESITCLPNKTVIKIVGEDIEVDVTT